MELTTYLNAMRDPSGVPFYPVVFQFFLVLTFALHIMFVNFLLGGVVVSIWARIKGTPNSLRLSKALARASTINASLAMVLGVAPLLFVQVIYDPFWYTANSMSAYWAMAFLLLLAVAFTASYVFYLSGKDKAPGASGWAILALLALLAAGAVIHALSVEQLLPHMWKSWLISGNNVDASGKSLYAFEWHRFLHFMAPSIAMAGVYLMLYAWFFQGRKDYDNGYLQETAKTGANIALYATAAQIVIGLWWLFSIPMDLAFYKNPFFLIGAGLGAAFFLFLMTARANPIKNAPITGLIAFLTIFFMSYAREALRMAYTGKAGYSIFDYKLSMDWGSTVLFLGTFVMGLIVMSYPIMVAVQVAKNGKESNNEGLAKLATALPVVWFLVVAGLGIVISLKNGTLF